MAFEQQSRAQFHRRAAGRGLAHRLDTLALPSEGFVTAEPEPIDLLTGTVGRR